MIRWKRLTTLNGTTGGTASLSPHPNSLADLTFDAVAAFECCIQTGNRIGHQEDLGWKGTTRDHPMDYIILCRRELSQAAWLQSGTTCLNSSKKFWARMRRSGSVRVDSASAAHHRGEQEDYCEYRIRHVERESHDRGSSSIAHAECLDRPHPAHDGRSKPRERNKPHYPGGERPFAIFRLAKGSLRTMRRWDSSGSPTRRPASRGPDRSYPTRREEVRAYSPLHNGGGRPALCPRATSR